MLQAGILATYVTDWLGAANVRRFGVQFREQVWPGDTLTCTGTVTKRYEDGGERLVDLELACTRQTGGLAIKGWATFVAP
jgi:acyl dehydratase